MDDKTMNMLLDRLSELDSAAKEIGADVAASLEKLTGRLETAEREIQALRKAMTDKRVGEPDTKEAAARRDRIEKQVRGK